ncbi:MAG TPA: hypothetical protein VLE22_05650 [Bryobacteraceae bacterium]|nr:hypothetical protein [Bryobacteraceae bacterium]
MRNRDSEGAQASRVLPYLEGRRGGQTAPRLFSSTRIEDWLARAPIVVTEGPERGGVVGWLDEDDVAPFVYGEASGYYLTFLTWLARETGISFTTWARREAVLGWCRRWTQGNRVPPTRCILDGYAADWRNGFQFSFDLAMVLRGLVHAGCESPARSLLAYLCRFVSPAGTLRVALPLNKDCADVHHWSVEPGPCQLKTAAAILSASDFGIPEALRVAVGRSIDCWRRTTDPSGEAHPFLYFIEGLILCGYYLGDRSLWRTAAETYARLLDHQTADCGLPASVPDSGSVQGSDVIAQALRIGCLLRHLGHLKPYFDTRLEGLASALDRFLLADGAVSFLDPRLAARTHRNTWCAMFAHQAYCLYGRFLRGAAMPASFLDVMV